MTFDYLDYESDRQLSYRKKWEKFIYVYIF